MGKIIQFRLPARDASGNAGFEIPVKRNIPSHRRKKKPAVISVMPDKPFPIGHKDFRPLLQRDGLILLSWALWEGWRDNGSLLRRYIVTWVVSRGKALHYATKAVAGNELEQVVPQRRADAYFYRGLYGSRCDIDSYYDRETADYVYLAAPFDLGKKTIPGFINVLKTYGSTVNFDYEFSFRRALKSEAQAYLETLAASQEA